jgi:hypothetical protein
VTLIAEVVAKLEATGVAYALIGAAALALRGASRATEDVDLLVVDAAVLSESFWADLRSSGARCAARRGDAQDPLAGVVRCEVPGQRTVDVIVGKARWQSELLERAVELEVAFAGRRLPVAQPADLVLLKLYAGGPQDAWDIHQLLAGPDGPSVRREVEARLPSLPLETQRLWARFGADPSGG